MIARIIEVRKNDLHLYSMDLKGNFETIVKEIEEILLQGHSIIFSPNSSLREKIADKLDLLSID